MIDKAYAKINVFLKITGRRGGYHTLISRFVRVNNLYDTVSFVPNSSSSFTIEGCGDVPIEENTIYKSYLAIKKFVKNPETIEQFFRDHKVVVDKRIPSGAGLGGGSSDSATFMKMLNRVCGLGISIPDLAEIGSTIGADVPFFIYGYSSANVSGFGEIVEEFIEEPLNIELYTPDIHCNTALVYRAFKENFLNSIDRKSFIGWEDLDSKEVLKGRDAISVNDLYRASLLIYPELRGEARDGWYFSGSGSTFFRLL